MTRLLYLWTLIATRLFGASVWIAGVVLASGFWSTFFAIFFPPWGMYLTAERALKAIGWL